MLTIAICDDQAVYREQLDRSIKRFVHEAALEVTVMHFQSGEELLDFQREHTYFFDALFLDIYMTGLDGMEVAQELRKVDGNVPIVFLTSSPDHAVASYSVSAFDYILKPYAYAQIERVCERIFNHHRLSRQETICIKSHQNLYTIDLKKVVYFESTLRTITAHFHDGTELTFYKKMADLEQEIANRTFVRIHRSYCVNLLYVQNIIQTDVVTTKQQRLPISKKYLQATKSLFEAYLFQSARGNA